VTPAELSRTVLRTVRRAVEAGELCAPVPARAGVRRSPRPGCGDYATAIALELAKPSGRSPRDVAEILRTRLARSPGIARVDIAEPGFLNITLDDGARHSLVETVLAQGRAYGHVPPAVSRVAAPVPGAVTACGSASVPVYEPALASGSGPAYAFGDAGPHPQGTADACCGGAKESGDTHHEDTRTGHWVRLVFSRDVRAAVTADAVARILRSQGIEAVTLHCEHDPDPVWAELGVTAVTAVTAVAAAIEEPGAGHPANGRPQPPSTACVYPVRPVPARLSAAHLLRTLGSDATRWALLRPVGHDPAHPDPARLLVQREVNPLFRIQYAHARAHALVREAGRLEVLPARGPEQAPAAGSADSTGSRCTRHQATGATGPTGATRPTGSNGPGLLAGPGSPGNPGANPADLDAPAPSASAVTPGLPDAAATTPLLAALGAYPAVLASAARLRAPDRVARHLEAVADAFFRFHDTCPVLPRGDEKPGAAHRAGAALAQATGTVLAGGLHLLGITAPNQL
jgi:arginyl-tRNA synthetase